MSKRYDFKNIREVIASLTDLVGQTNNPVTSNNSYMSQKPLWEKYRRETDVHSKGYLMPKILAARPNENEASLRNRLLNYEPVTTPFWNEAITKMKRILLASSADVMISEKMQEYVKADNFDGLALYDFFATNMMEQTINKPNGLTVVYPLKYAEKEKVNPIQFVCEKHIVYMDRNTVVFICLYESDISTSYNGDFYMGYGNATAVNYGDRTHLAGITYDIEPKITIVKPVYHVFSNGEFAEVNDRDTATNEWFFDAYKTYTDFLPCFQNGGIKVNDFVYKSFFHHAIHFGNKALSRASDNDAVDAMFSYPHTEMVADECNMCYGSGLVKSDVPNHLLGLPYTEKTCDTCKGSGEVITMSPYKVMLRKRAQSNADPQDTNVDAVKFYSPDVAILQHSSDNWRGYLELFKTSLHVISRRDTKQAESGHSIEKQYEPLYDFMHNVGMTLYNNLEQILRALQAQVDPISEKPSVTRPISYHLVEEGEAFTVLAIFLEKDMPTYLRRQYIRNFISKYMGSKSAVLKFIEVLEGLDPFMYYTTAQKEALLLSGAMNKMQYRVSIAQFGVMVQMMSEEKYKDADREVITKEIEKRIAAFTVDPMPTIPVQKPITQTI